MASTAIQLQELNANHGMHHGSSDHQDGGFWNWCNHLSWWYDSSAGNCKVYCLSESSDDPPDSPRPGIFSQHRENSKEYFQGGEISRILLEYKDFHHLSPREKTPVDQQSSQENQHGVCISQGPYISDWQGEVHLTNSHPHYCLDCGAGNSQEQFHQEERLDLLSPSARRSESGDQTLEIPFLSSVYASQNGAAPHDSDNGKCRPNGL